MNILEGSDFGYQVLNELFFNRKPKKKEYEDIEPKIPPKEAIAKLQSLINKELSSSKEEYVKFLKGKLKINPKIAGQDQYNAFINGQDNYLTVCQMNLKSFMGKVYKGEKLDEYDYGYNTACDIVQDLTDKKIEPQLNKLGYSLDYDGDAGDFSLDIILKTGARIKVNNESFNRI